MVLTYQSFRQPDLFRVKSPLAAIVLQIIVLHLFLDRHGLQILQVSVAVFMAIEGNASESIVR